MKYDFSSYKKTLFVALAMLFVVPQVLLAQTEKPKNLLLYDQQPYHFGFIVGINQMAYTFDYKNEYQNILYGFQEHQGYDHDLVILDRVHDGIFDKDDIIFTNQEVVSAYKPGFTVGVVGNLRLAKYFDLRLIPSLSFGEKFVSYNYCIEGSNNKKSYKTDATTARVVTIDLPLLVKYRSKRHNNFAAYIIAGGNPRFDLSPLYSGKKMIKSRVFDLAAEIGTGVDFYNGYFKFGIEAKMSFGLLNTLNYQNNQYDASINGLHNRMFQLSLTFE